MSKEHSSPGRLEAFSDGVIAVIITIMVLELKVPVQDGLAGLHSVVPTLLVYLLSFAFTGIYWVNHHDLVRRIKYVDPFVLNTNLLFLFSLSLLPFFTGYVLDKRIDTFSVLLYAATMIFNGLTFGLLRFAVNRILCRTEELNDEDIAIQRKHMFSFVIYLVSLPLAYWKPHAAMADIALVTLLWIIPSFGTQPHKRHPEHPVNQP